MAKVYLWELFLNLQFDENIHKKTEEIVGAQVTATTFYRVRIIAELDWPLDDSDNFDTEGFRQKLFDYLKPRIPWLEMHHLGRYENSEPHKPEDGLKKFNISDDMEWNQELSAGPAYVLHNDTRFVVRRGSFSFH